MNNPFSEQFCCQPEITSVVTVQSVAGIKGLNNCFVHVLDNNTVYYVDSQHHTTVVSSQVVELTEYDSEKNPLNLRNQIAYDTKRELLTYFDNSGLPHTFDGDGGSADFDKLQNRPTYAGQLMTGATDIPAVPTKLGELEDGNRITLLENDVKQVQTETGRLDTNLATSVSVAGQVSTVSLVTHLTNPATGATSQTSAEFPVASVDRAGVLAAADYAKIEDTAAKVAGLSGAAVAINGLPADPTQIQLTDAWKAASGETELVNGASINDITNSKTWTYYVNLGEWTASAGSGAAQLWTVDTPGSVKSGSADGELGAQANGTGKVVGWDAITNKVSTLDTTVNEFASSLNQIEVNVSDLQEGKQDTLVGEGDGQNIKTVGGVNILGTGDIPVGSGGAATALGVKYFQKSYHSQPELTITDTYKFDSPETLHLEAGKKYLVFGTLNIGNLNDFPVYFSAGTSFRSTARVFTEYTGCNMFCGGSTNIQIPISVIYDPSAFEIDWDIDMFLHVAAYKASDDSIISNMNARIFWYNLAAIELQ